MSDKNLLIGNTNYPHLSQSTNENICAQLRELAPELVEHHTKQIVFAVDRIEQLERELADAQKDAKRYYWLQDWLESKTSCTLVFCKAVSRQEYDQAIDAAIQEGK